MSTVTHVAQDTPWIHHDHTAIMVSGYSEILELAGQIPRLTEAIAQYLDKQQLPAPSYQPDSRAPETPQYDALLAPLNEVTQDLLRLVNGPKRSLASLMLAHYDLAAFQVALECGFFEAVPIGDGASIPVKDLSKIVKVDEDRVRRIIKFLATHRVFVEIEPDIFQHTSASALFAMDMELKAAGLMQSVFLKTISFPFTG